MDTTQEGQRAFYAACVNRYKKLCFLSEQIDLSKTCTIWTMKAVPVDRAVVFWDEYETEVVHYVQVLRF